MLSSRLRTLAIANAVVLVAAVLSIGQVNFANSKDAATTGVDAANGPAPIGAVGSVSPSSSPGAKKPGSKGSASPLPGSNLPGAPGSVPAVVAQYNVPDFGLKTQGVTDKTVTIGSDYDKSGCGGADALSNSFSSSVTGDPVRSTDAFTRYINDTGGIRGRKLIVKLVDDGGLYCPEKHKSAEIELVKQDKVFMDIAGLHEVSELLAKDHIPFMGGESAVADELKQGYGQFQLFQDADGDFANWASFGNYYINSKTQTPCFVHPDTADFNGLEPILDRKLAAYGIKFKDTIRYTDAVQNAAGQAISAVVKMKTDGCKQVWLLANNAIGAVFITAAAKQENWYPTWTWTARTALIDQKLAGGLMQQDEWKHSIGLTTRIKDGQSPYQDKCKKIYDKYYSGDGKDGSAATLIACESILISAEAMRRAVDITGVLTANSLMLGVNAIRGDFYYDSHVPITYSVPGLKGPLDFTGYDIQTVAKWNTNRGDYDFPEFPYYWKTFGQGNSGKINVLPFFKLKYTPPKR